MAVNQWLNQAANISINYVGPTAYIHVPTNGSYNIYLNPNQRLNAPYLHFNMAEWPLKFDKIKYWGNMTFEYGTAEHLSSLPTSAFFGDFTPRNNVGYIGNGVITLQNFFYYADALCTPNASGDLYFNIDFPTQYEAAGASILGRVSTTRQHSEYTPALLAGLFYNVTAPTHNMVTLPRFNWVNLHVRGGSILNNYIYNYMVCNYYENSSKNYQPTYTKIQWTDMENGYYNSSFKIRVYYNNPHSIAFNNLKDISFAFRTGGIARNPNVAGLQPICSDNVVNMIHTYDGWHPCTGRPVCGNNVVDMSYAYASCYNLTGSPVCGNNVKYLCGTYSSCNHLTGSPVVGNNVIDMYYAYAGCTNLTGSPAVLNNNVKNMAYAYSGCINLTGHPQVGYGVINMAYAFRNCTNLNGVAAAGRNVIDMSYAYYNCYKLYGTPLCGPATEIMNYTYYNCGNLTNGTEDLYNVKILNYTYYNCNNLGPTAAPVSVNKVWFASDAFSECKKIQTVISMFYNLRIACNMFKNCTGLRSDGSALGLLYFDRYFLSSNVLYNINHSTGAYVNEDVVFARNMFYGVSNRMDVHVVKDREWDIYLRTYPNRNQFKNMNITWSNMANGLGYYNTAANIYVFTNHSYSNDSSAPYYGYNVMNEVNASKIYYNRGDLIGTPVCGDIIQNLAYTYYYCNNLTGSPACGNNVYNMSWAYESCQNLTGAPVVGRNVKQAISAYSHCYNLTGNPVCPDSVILATNMYYSCSNLTGSPVVGNNVTDMVNMYASCYNLTGSPVFGPNVTNVANAYARCSNLTGTFVLPNNVPNLQYLYSGCSNLTGSLDLLLNDGNHDYIDCLNSTFQSCSKLTGSPWCGPNVYYFGGAYLNCGNLTGSPVCGNNVVNMASTYSNCTGLTGSPVCGPNVGDMQVAYSNCIGLTGNPVCGPNVWSMMSTYSNCINLTGQPVFGPMVNKISYSYYGCVKLTGTVYWNFVGDNSLNTIAKVAGNTSNAFGGRENVGSRINLYVSNRTIFNSLRNIANYSSLVGNVVWNNFGTNFFFNTTHNLYVYTGSSYPTNTYTVKITGTGTNCLLNSSASYSATSSTTTAKYNVVLTADGVNWRVPAPTDLNTWIKIWGAEYDYTMTNNISATISLKNMAPDVQINAHGAIKQYSVTITGDHLSLNGSSTYNATIDSGLSDTITLTASGDYKLPATVELGDLNATYTRTSDTTGTITICPTGTTQSLSGVIIAAIKRADLMYNTTNCTSSSSNPSQCTDANYSSLSLVFTFDGTNYTCPVAGTSKVSVTGAEYIWTKDSDTSGHLTLTSLSSNDIVISIAGQSTGGAEIVIDTDFSNVAPRYGQINIYASSDGLTEGNLITNISESTTTTISVTSPYIIVEQVSWMTMVTASSTGGVSEYGWSGDGYPVFAVNGDGTMDISLHDGGGN